jgi:hypothetical protein
MMPTEQENFDERSYRGQGSTPKPDPTILTTEMTMREISALRTLIDQRISATEKLFDTKIQLGREGGAALKELFGARLADLEKMLNERYTTQGREVAAALSAAEKSVAAAMLAADKAVEKANVASEKRFESVNEFRAQQGDLVRTFVPRAEIDTMVNAIEDKLTGMQSAIDRGFTGVNVRNATGREVVSSALERREDARGNIAIMIAVSGTLLTLALILVTQFHR